MDRTPLLKAKHTQPWVPYYSGPWVEGKDYRSRHCISDASYTSQTNAARLTHTSSVPNPPSIDRFHGASLESKSTKALHEKRRKRTFSQLSADRGQLIPCRRLKARPCTGQNESPPPPVSKPPSKLSSLSIVDFLLA